MERVRFQGDERARILAASRIEEGAQADELIEIIELMSSSFLYDTETLRNYPTGNRSVAIINKLVSQAFAFVEIVEFGGDLDLADKFWIDIFYTQYGSKYHEVFSKHRKFVRDIKAAMNKLTRLSRKENEVRSLSNNLENEIKFLKQLSCVYFHVLKRKPGRSKSTIGPFTRFAHAVMEEVLLCETSIESLNERWARLKYDATRTKFVPENFEAMKALLGE